MGLLGLPLLLLALLGPFLWWLFLFLNSRLGLLWDTGPLALPFLLRSIGSFALSFALLRYLLRRQ